MKGDEMKVFKNIQKPKPISNAMIKGANAGYSNAYYYVFDNEIYRYDGVRVDTCIDLGNLRNQEAFKALFERINKSQNPQALKNNLIKGVSNVN